MNNEKVNYVYAILSTLISIITFCMVLYHMKLSGFHIGVFFDKYWDRIILLSGIVGFFVRELYKLSMKKEEVKFTLYQKKIFDCIQEYMIAYEDYRKAMKDLPYGVFKGTIQGHSLDEITTRRLNNLKQADLILKVFIEEDLYKQYKRITERSDELIGRLNCILKDGHLVGKDKYQTALNRNTKYNIAYIEFATDIESLISVALEETHIKLQ